MKQLERSFAFFTSFNNVEEKKKEEKKKGLWWTPTVERASSDSKADCI